jgi:hypothetical protein
VEKGTPLCEDSGIHEESLHYCCSQCAKRLEGEAPAEQQCSVSRDRRVEKPPKRGELRSGVQTSPLEGEPPGEPSCPVGQYLASTPCQQEFIAPEPCKWPPLLAVKNAKVAAHAYSEAYR